MAAEAFDLIGLDEFRMDSRFSGIDGTDVGIAVLDTGVDPRHATFGDNIVAAHDFWQNASGNAIVDAHGTHVAAIAASADPSIGVATDANIIALQVFEPGRIGQQPLAYHTVSALRWVYENREQYNIRVVNMSLGGGAFRSPQEAGYTAEAQWIDLLESEGITVVSATGNAYEDYSGRLQGYANSGAPGIHSSLNVGAVWDRATNFNLEVSTGPDRLTFFSQRPPNQFGNDLLAPGGLIESAVPGGYEEMNGTSMAAPMVAGAVALVQEAASEFLGRYLSVPEVVSVLRDNADQVYDGDDEQSLFPADADGDGRAELYHSQYTNDFYRRLNVHRSLQAVYEWANELDDGSDHDGGNGTGADAQDRNGTLSTSIEVSATQVMDGSLIRGRLGVDGNEVMVGSSDVDVFRFQVGATSQATIETSQLSAGLGDPADTYLRLFDSSGNSIAENDDVAGSYFSRVDVTLAPGTYYAAVSGYGNSRYNPTSLSERSSGSTGVYGIRWSGIEGANDGSGGGDPTGSSRDQNGTRHTAVPVILDRSSQAVRFDGEIGSDYGTPNGGYDVDVFRLTAPASGSLVIDLDSPTNTPVDSYLRVFDSSGTPIVSADDVLATDWQGNPTEFVDGRWPELVFEHPTDRQYFNGHVTDAFARLSVIGGHTYYVAVSDYANRSYDVDETRGRSDRGSGGGYAIHFAMEHGDTNGMLAQSTPLGMDSSISAAIGNDPSTGSIETDVDFYEFTADSGATLSIDVRSFQDRTRSDPVDTVLFLFDSDGNLLLHNDDTNGLDPAIRFDPIAGETYHVAVAGYGNHYFAPDSMAGRYAGAQGGYELSVSRLSQSQVFAMMNQSVEVAPEIDLSEIDYIHEIIGSDNGFAVENDVDYFRVLADRDGTLPIEVSGNTLGGVDPAVRILSDDGQLVAPGQRVRNRRASSVQPTVEAGQYYVIEVRAAANTNPSDEPDSSNTLRRDVGGYQVVFGEFIPNDQPARPRFQNASDVADTNDDGAVTVLDALRVINQLRLQASQTDGNDEAIEADFFYDVNGDDRLSALDALMVLNEIRLRGATQLEGESTIIAADRDEAVDSAIEELIAVPLDEIRFF